MSTVDGGLSVIIRVRNEERWIGHAIQSVFDFHPDAHIVVLDDYSADDSLRVVELFHPFQKITIFDPSRLPDKETYSPGAALNKGVTFCEGENILVMSAHCQLTSPVDTKHLERYCAVWGKQIPIRRGKRVVPRYIWKNFGPEPKINYISPGEDRYFLHNALALYKKDTLKQFEFDCQLRGKEDRYWAHWMIEDHKREILYSPDLHCLHHWTENGATWRDS